MAFGPCRTVATNPEPAVARFRALLARKQSTEAVAEANEGVRLPPGDDEYAVRGDIFQALGRTQDAKADYDKALTINKDNEFAVKGTHGSRRHKPREVARTGSAEGAIAAAILALTVS